MIEIKGLEKITALVQELQDFKGKGMKSTVRASLQKAAQVVAKQVKKNIKGQIKSEGHKSTGTMARSVVVRRYGARNKNLIRYKIISRKKPFFSKDGASKTPYYAIMYEYGHVDKGWNASGDTKTKGRHPFTRAKRALDEGKIEREILEKTAKQLKKQIDKACKK